MTYRVAPLEKKPELDCPRFGLSNHYQIKLKQCYVNYVKSVVEPGQLAALQCNCKKSLFQKI